MCFPWGYDEEDERYGALKLILLNMINYWRADGITSFSVPMDAGIGLYAAELLNSLREKDSELALTCIVPWEEQATKWTPELRDRYFNALARCSTVETVSFQRTATCELEAKLRAVDLTDGVYAVVTEDKDPFLETALHYARHTGKNVLVFDTEKIDLYG